jgi:hypothetical protein
MHELPLMRAIRAAIASEAPRRATLWRNPVGFDDQTKTHFGLGRGSADLVGLLHGSGRLIGLEVKTPSGRLKPDQIAWLSVVRTRGGFAAVVRSVPEALAALDRACAGATE